MTATTLSPALVAHLPTGLLVDGHWGPVAGGATFEVTDPATAEPIFDVSDATPADAVRALDAAHAAAPAWRAVPPRERSDLLRAVFERLIARAGDIAALITAEAGKPLAEARAEVVYGAEFLRWFAEQAVRADGLVRTAPSGTNKQYVSRRPVGPTLLITPWNFPIAMATRKIAPALAAGCTVVIKPASLTPMTTLLVAEIIRSEAESRGLPAGIVNVVPTSRSGPVTEPLFADPRLRKVSFTGSTRVGSVLLEQAAKNVLRSSMELGGNAPFVVFEDADVDAAVEGALIAKLRNSGQSCVAANRFLVHDAVAHTFAEKLATAVGAKVTGPGTQPGAEVGPLINESAVEKVTGLVDDAVAHGAQVLTGGGRLDRPGHFFEPTVLTGISGDARIVTEEIFGPVAPIVAFGSDDEAYELANGTPFGLAAYAYTTSLARAQRAMDEIEAGMIGINRGLVSDASAPFGGVKASGLGREGGEAGMEEYQETVYVAM
ncbi:NAD-dependent succinate-semialdehyde dehydrogenase [Promicromonospora sp. NPDC023987]|uniref:NAD-dependent succinate-semialdehyde dehydrogenase n=1 Tax=Promicromonospora sp. NPDC023987 TaxID=3155360 RepID=UPI00340D56AB